MIDMPDRSNVYVRLAAIKFFLRHDCSLPLFVIPEGDLRLSLLLLFWLSSRRDLLLQGATNPSNTRTT
jgi:hypothetical protein